MGMQIRFDVNNNPEEPTIVLAKRNGEKIGKIPAEPRSIIITDELENPNEISFTVYKEKDGQPYEYWDDIKDFRTAWLREYDTWFELAVDTQESTETEKHVSGMQLGHAELSQTMIYEFEVNTEDDIARDDYTWNYLYNENDTSNSILHRLLSKVPHYHIEYIDDSLKQEGTQFSFDGQSVYDCLQEIAKEIGFYLYIPSNTVNGSINRGIYIYDAQTRCANCGYRGYYEDTCPECGSTNIIYPVYGEDTTIFVTIDELAESITYTSNKDSVKNCFNIEGGDDLITATVRNCNPNGTNNIWFITDDMKTDMSSALVSKINQYDTFYNYYINTYQITLDVGNVSDYNNLVNKYSSYKPDLSTITNPVVGYANLMQIYYDTIDLELFLESELMPSVSTSATSASAEAAKLTVANIGTVATNNLASTSTATANNLVLAMAKTLVHSGYQVIVSGSSSYNTSTHVWTGSFVVKNYSDESDSAISNTISITLSSNYQDYVYNQLKKSMSQSASNEDLESYDIVSLFSLSYANFVNELKKYCLARLQSFLSACQACINILIEQGIANQDSWDGQSPNLYDNLYTPYYNKLYAIIAEIALRENEISIITGTFDNDNVLLTNGTQTNIERVANNIRHTLNFENYLGTTLWNEFCAFRREDKYQNENYISDGLNNKQLFALAQELIQVAKKEIYKSALLQHSISANLYDLLLTPKFNALLNKFAVGNYIRVEIDNHVYKLRLIKYTVDYGNLNSIDVEFSDVIYTADGMSDAESLMSNITSLSTSYPSTKRNAKAGRESNTQLSHWVSDGLALTKMKIIDTADEQNVSWDEHGILCRKYEYETDSYNDKQVKIINSGLYVTNDNWLTSKAGIGNFIFWNPQTKQIEEAYGVIADTLVGNLILSQEVGIYNQTGSVEITEDGLSIIADGYSGDNTMQFTIGKTTNASGTNVENVLYIDTNGNLVGKFNNLTITGSGGNVPTVDDLPHFFYQTLFKSNNGSTLIHYNETSATSDTANSGDFCYYNSKTYIYENSQWQLFNSTNYDVLVNDYLVDSYDGSTYKWNGTNWIKVTDYKTKIDDSITYYDTYTLTQTKVFNKLTNNGALQGIFMENNNLYVNASYVKTGVLNSIAIQNGTAVGGVYPFSVDSSGNLVANSATIKGNITAQSGTIGGFTISSTANTGTSANGGHCYTYSLYAQSGDGTYEYEIGMKGEGNSQTDTSGYLAFYVKAITKGDSWSNATSLFYVTKGGKLYAKNAEIEGKITSNSGTIGGWSLTDGYIYRQTTAPTTSGTQYETYLAAPSSGITDSTVAIGVRKRTYTNGTASSWDYPFYVTYSGYMYSKSGKIGGWFITENYIYAYPESDKFVYLGNGTNSSGDILNVRRGTASPYTYPFYIQATGKVYASNFEMAGGSINISTSTETDDRINLNSHPDYSQYISKDVYLYNNMQAKGMTIGANWTINSSGLDNVGGYALYQCHTMRCYVNGYSTPPYMAGVLYSTTDGYKGYILINNRLTDKKMVEICEGTSSNNTPGGSIMVFDYNGKTRAGLAGETGYVYVENASSYYTAYMRGDTGACYAYSYNNLSDRNKKKNITYLNKNNSATFIYSLKPVSFKYIDGDDWYHHGFVAQEVESILYNKEWGVVDYTSESPETINKNKEMQPRYKTLAYTELIADMVATIQVQHQEIEDLKSQVSQLLDAVNKLVA